MKKNMKCKMYTLMAMLLLAIGLVACDGSDGEADYGFAYLYMPQATSGGGLDNNYHVPSGGGSYTANYKIKDGKLEIILGVLRSGQLSNSAYSVDIISRADTTRQIVASGAIPDAVALAENQFSLPAKVDVPSDKSGETFYLSVPVEVLKEVAFAGKKLIVTVGITNPTKYELNTRKTSTVVIVDVDAMLDKLP